MVANVPLLSRRREMARAAPDATAIEDSVSRSAAVRLSSAIRRERLARIALEIKYSCAYAVSG